MKGSMVRVSKGRKVPVGTTGVVFWMGDGRYGTRVGIRDAEGEVHWTAASNCTVLEAAPPAAPFVAPVGLVKGVEVMTPHGMAKVFWVGEDKRNPGAARVGVKLTSGMSMFLGEAEVEMAGAYKAPTASAPVVARERDREAEEVAEERAAAREAAANGAPRAGAAFAWAGEEETANGKAA